MIAIRKTSLGRDGSAGRIARPGAFTLIELLVVIAIISLLVSLLMPVLKKAKDMARNTICQSNVRAIAYAVNMYQTEANSLLPPSHSVTGGLDSPLALWTLMKSGHLSVDSTLAMKSNTGTNYPDVRYNPLLLCPDAKLQISYWNISFKRATYANGGTVDAMVAANGDYVKVSLSGSRPPDWFRVFSTYQPNGVCGADNSHFGMAGRWPFESFNQNGWARGQSMDRFKHPGETWLLADGYFAHIGLLDGITFRHPNTSANFAYADGHAESLRVGEITGRPAGSQACHRGATFSGSVNRDVWDRRLSISDLPAPTP